MVLPSRPTPATRVCRPPVRRPGGPARARRVEEVEVHPEDTTAIEADIRRLAAAHDGWINLQPVASDEDTPPPGRGLAILFGAAPTAVPVCTWVAGHVDRRGVRPDQIGIQHGTGPRALSRLAAEGLALPSGWRWRQDNARRGIVIDLPGGCEPGTMLAWLMAAGRQLALTGLDGRWRARIFYPR